MGWSRLRKYYPFRRASKELIMPTTPDIGSSTFECYCDTPIEVAVDPFATASLSSLDRFVDGIFLSGPTTESERR